jgi:NADH:ubiquinone oxidoreductase subunit 2 (subunit N)
VVSLYPYLRMIAPAVLDRPAARWRLQPPSPALAAAAIVATIATVAIGIGAEPFLALAKEAGASRG